MLRFADELLLLLIDDKRGDLIPIPQWSLACALAGGFRHLPVPQSLP